MEVSFLISIQPNSEWTHFKGELTLPGVIFSYEVTCDKPIREKASLLRGKATDEARKLIDLQVGVAGAPLELEDDEWRIFYQVVIELLLQLDSRHQKHLKKKRVTEAPAMSFSDGTVVLPPRACAVLARPKFGCQLTGAINDKEDKIH